MRKSALKTRVAEVRNTLEMKTPEFAKMVGLSVSALEKIETGRLKLSEDVAFRIARETGAHIDWLLDSKDNRYNNVSPLQKVRAFKKEDFENRFAGRALPPETSAEIVKLFSFLYDEYITGILKAAWEKGKGDLCVWKLNRALEQLGKEFGVSGVALIDQVSNAHSRALVTEAKSSKT